MPSALRAIGLSAPVRLAAAVPDLTLCDPMRNADAVIRAILHAETLKADYLALPELCLTGATAGALLRHPLILQESLAALKRWRMQPPAAMSRRASACPIWSAGR